MKFITVIVLIIIAVGVFSVAGNTKKETPREQTVTEFILSDPNNRQ